MQLFLGRLVVVVIGFVVLSCAAATPTRAAELPHHHLAVFLGSGVESKPGRQDEQGFAFGVEYEFRFHERWGVGAVVEALGQDTVRNVLVVAPFSFHPGKGWRLVVGPGVEFTPTKDKFAVRLGTGYEFHISEHWTVAPEFFLDLIETGENTWVGGVAFGYGF